MKRVLVIFSFVVSAFIGFPVFGDNSPGTDSLKRFFREVNSVTARFKQVVLDERQNPIQESSGMLWIERPNKFRWNYDKPYQQQIVADGSRLWVYDIGLQQISVRKLSGSLGDTPAMLLAGRGRLEDSFNIQPLANQNDFEWVKLIPKHPDSGYVEIRIGFLKRTLRVLEMADSFGQITRVTLEAPRENAPIDASKFKFTPPEGVDVVGE